MMNEKDNEKSFITKYRILILFVLLLIPFLIFLPTYLLQDRYGGKKQIEIIATGEKNQASEGREVWVDMIRVNGKDVIFADLDLGGGWKYEKDIFYTNSSTPVRYVLEVDRAESVMIAFLQNARSGIVKVQMGEQLEELDLFSSEDTRKVIELKGKSDKKEGFSLFSVQFILLLLVVSCIYFALNKKHASYQWVILLISSYIFYAATGIVMLIPIVITTIMTWFGAIAIEKTTGHYKVISKKVSGDERKRVKLQSIHKKRGILTLIIILNLGILIVFKYTNFFIENINILGNKNIRLINFWVPLGLSFYTFQTIGYLIDIYRGKYVADKNLFKFALFVSYFPQVIQGPISRYDQLSRQLYTGHAFEYDRVKYGAQRMLWGYFKKMVIADRIAIIVNTVFSAFLGDSAGGVQYTGVTVFLSVLLYSVQIYADFSGGMDIVLGVSQIFGIELVENFRRPFMAKSVAEFWQRWHITLGGWMRDYLFYPLALSKPFANMAKRMKNTFGNYVAKILPTCLASFIVFFLIGVWHGADWKYIIYGIYQATFVSTASLLEPIYSRLRAFFKVNIHCYSWKIFQTVRTVLLLTIGRYFSRADSAEVAFDMLKATFVQFNPWIFFDGSLYELGLDEKNFRFMIFSLAFLFIVDFAQERGVLIREKIARQDVVFRWSIYLAGIFSIIIFGVYGVGFDSANFIYQGF